MFFWFLGLLGFLWFLGFFGFLGFCWFRDGFADHDVFVALFCLVGPHGNKITSHLASIGGATAEVVRAAGDVASASANMIVAVSHLAVGAISISVFGGRGLLAWR